MDKLINITLIKVTETVNEIGEVIKNETERKLRGQISYINSAEWFEAKRNDINSKWRVFIYDFEYKGETIAVIDGVRYSIYRTYYMKGNKLELYLEEKGGI